MKSYFSGRISYYYYGGRRASRSQPTTALNVVKLFVLKIMMATFFCASMLLFQQPSVFGNEPLALSAASSSLIMGVGCLFLLNRKLIRMRI